MRAPARKRYHPGLNGHGRLNELAKGKFMHDVEVVACVDFVGGQHAIFTVNFKDGNRDPQVAGKLESLGLCKTRSYDI